MKFAVEATYQSLNKFSEYLCGDRVKILKLEDRDVMILADGMGSGVQANILSTLTSTILGTMLTNGATLEDGIETIAQTLPINPTNGMAYSTFSILEICHDGQAYLAEFDNPECIFIRDGRLVKLDKDMREIDDKMIFEAHFQVQKGDAFLLMSDGTTHAGIGGLLGFGWPWEDIADYACRKYREGGSALRLVSAILQSCDEFDNFKPGDDITVGCMRVIEKKDIHLLTGPAKNMEDDEAMVRSFMENPAAKKVVCGGTSAKIVSRVLNRPIDQSLDKEDSDVPPISFMRGIDLVTEGVLTMNRALRLLNQYADNKNINEDFFELLDQNNGASLLARMLLEECTYLHLYVGTATNIAYHNPDLPFDLGIRQGLVDKLKEVMEKLNKKVKVTYY